jgi:hypothetical protein
MRTRCLGGMPELDRRTWFKQLVRRCRSTLTIPRRVLDLNSMLHFPLNQSINHASRMRIVGLGMDIVGGSQRI